MASRSNTGEGVAPFSEKGFYLRELRDRTIAIAGPAPMLRKPGALKDVLDELEANRTRVVIVSDASDASSAVTGAPALPAEDLATLPGRVWRALAETGRVGVLTDASVGFAPSCCAVVSRLRIGKLVRVDAGGGLVTDSGRRDSFIDARQLRERLADPTADRRPLLVEMEALLTAGLAAVNLCTLEGVADELFTYDGSGTLFTREGYVSVRSLGLDDFDAAFDLIERGMAEGYLAPRSPEQIERVLESGFGAFVGGDHLAGIGTLLVYPGEPVAEIGSLYTLTRFLGEGVGGHLVRFALESARGRGCRRVFAVTTSERVAAFFRRNGFDEVGLDRVPTAKWRDYDPARRNLAHCLERAT